MNRKLPKEMACWQAFSYIQPGLNFKGSLTHNKSRVMPALKTANQVLVKVKTASLNPIDSVQLRGYGNKSFRAIYNITNNLHNPTASLVSELPITPGRDFFGEIVSVGQSVNRNDFRVGDLVVGSSHPFMSSLDGGSLAEYLVAEKRQIVKVSDRVGDKSNQLVTLPYAGITAWSALEDSGCVKITDRSNLPTKKILIPGATGMVGFTLAQLAKISNAFTKIDTVIPNTEDAKKMLAVLKSNGIVDNVFTTDEALPRDYKYDLIIDCVRRTSPEDENSILSKLTENGRLVSLNSPVLRNQDEQGLFLGTISAGLNLIQKNMNMGRLNPLDPGYAWAFYRPTRERLDKLIHWYIQGKLTIGPVEEMPFDKADEGLDRSATPGHYGKVVIKID